MPIDDNQLIYIYEEWNGDAGYRLFVYREEEVKATGGFMGWLKSWGALVVNLLKFATDLIGGHH